MPGWQRSHCGPLLGNLLVNLFSRTSWKLDISFPKSAIHSLGSTMFSFCLCHTQNEESDSVSLNFWGCLELLAKKYEYGRVLPAQFSSSCGPYAGVVHKSPVSNRGIGIEIVSKHLET